MVTAVVGHARKIDPRPIYFGFFVFDDQHNQIGLMNLQVIVL